MRLLAFAFTIVFVWTGPKTSLSDFFLPVRYNWWLVKNMCKSRLLLNDMLVFNENRLYVPKFSLTWLIKRHNASPLIKPSSVMNGWQKCVY